MIKFDNGAVRVPSALEWGTLCARLGPEMSKRMHCEESVPFWMAKTIDDSAQVYFPEPERNPQFVNREQRKIYAEEGEEEDIPIGFRPAFVVPSYLLTNFSPGDFVVLNISLLMNEAAVPCSGNWSYQKEDIPDYVPGAILETQRLLHSPISYLRTYYVGDNEFEGPGKSVLIADRVLLKNISFQDLYAQGYAGLGATP